jgi:hypothetical protein
MPTATSSRAIAEAARLSTVFVFPKEFESWSGIRESNPRLDLGKVAYYHYTNPAWAKAFIAWAVRGSKAPVSTAAQCILARAAAREPTR